MVAPNLRTHRLTDPAANKPLLLVGPGIGTGVQELWNTTAQHLASDFEVIGYNLPGHAGAPTHTDPYSVKELADAAAALVADQPTERSIFFAGVSISGGVAMELALHHPERFAAVAVVCSAPKIGEPEAWEERAQAAAANGTEIMVPFCREGWFAPGFIDENPAQAEALLDNLRQADLVSYVTICRALGTYDVRDDLATITIPVLTINGAHDHVCPPSEGATIAAGVPHGKAVTFNHTAHLAPVEDPERTASELRTFFLAQG